MQSRKRGRRVPKAVLPTIYLVILTVLIVFAVIEDVQEKNAVYGDTSEVVVSNITVEWEGLTYRYRERDMTNDLLIGVDYTQIMDGSSQDNGQAVLLVLLCADKKKQTITPIVVDPDTIVTVTSDENLSNEKRIRIGQAQVLPGQDMPGSEHTVWAMSQLFYGVPIDHYIAVDIDRISLLNDAIGGVSIALEDDLAEMDSELVQGTMVSLNAEQAKEFLCSRMNPVNGTDVSRTERQKIYLHHLREKLVEDTGGKRYLLKEISKLDGYYTTDLRGSELLRILHRCENYEWQEIIDIPGEYHSDEDGVPEFRLNETQMWKILGKLWFEEEHTEKVTKFDE